MSNGETPNWKDLIIERSAHPLPLAEDRCRAWGDWQADLCQFDDGSGDDTISQRCPCSFTRDRRQSGRDGSTFAWWKRTLANQGYDQGIDISVLKVDMTQPISIVF
jgi:hypothetical protein